MLVSRLQTLLRCVYSLTFTSADAQIDTGRPSHCPGLHCHFCTLLMALGPSYWEPELGPHRTVALLLPLEELMKMQFARPHSCCCEGRGPREVL